MTAGGDRMAPLLAIQNLSVSYQTERGRIHAVRDLSLELRRGELLGVVGESGCGKSTLAFALLGYFPGNAVVGGSILFAGEELLKASPKRLRHLRGNRIAMVYQDPAQALSPNRRVGSQVAEVLREHRGLSRRAADRRAAELFDSVNLPDAERVGRRFPHQLSGGQQQRVVIAMALACEPDLLVMDEPTTGLDVTTEAAVTDLVLSLKGRVDAAILYVTHNLGVVSRIADRVLVMYAGEAVEEASREQLFSRARHPYTVGLLSSVPRQSAEAKRLRIPSIPGVVYPAGAEKGEQCLFASRCPLAVDHCRSAAPDLFPLAEGQRARCFRWTEAIPEIWESGGERHQHPRPPEAPLLEVRKLCHFHGSWVRQMGRGRDAGARAVADVSFRIRSGVTLGLVGESGSGKTTVAKVVAGLLAPTEGAVTLRGALLAGRVEDRRREQRAALQMIFQNPAGSLNPKLPVGHSVVRSLRRAAGLDRRQAKTHARELFEALGLDVVLMRRRPGELSGGQQQRVALAAAFAADPRLIIADEAVSALDVSVQAQVLDLLDRRQREAGTAYLFISHDLAVVRYLADEILVMCDGHMAEYGPADAVLSAPSHPYTAALLAAAPTIEPLAASETRQRLDVSRSNTPAPAEGCFFEGRCPRSLGVSCRQTAPPARLDPLSEGHVIFCHLSLDELAASQQPRGAAGTETQRRLADRACEER